MSKVDIKKIVADVQKLYNKDKKATALITTGASVIQKYTENDVVPLQKHRAFRQLFPDLPGLPYNKITQFAGRPDSGKSTVAAELIVDAQASGHQVIVWDSEDKFDAFRLKVMGGNPDEILLAKTNEILKGAELLRKYITAVKEQTPGARLLIVWDSAGGSQSRSHAERELDNEKHAQPGQDAKEIAQVMRMFVSLINKYPDSIAIYIANQTYAKIGFMQHGDSASGGMKLEFHSSYIVFLKRIKVLTKIVKGIKVKTGILTRATVTKDHLAQGEFSTYQMDFVVNSKGYTVSEGGISDDEEADE